MQNLITFTFTSKNMIKKVIKKYDKICVTFLFFFFLHSSDFILEQTSYLVLLI